MTTHAESQNSPGGTAAAAFDRPAGRETTHSEATAQEAMAAETEGTAPPDAKPGNEMQRSRRGRDTKRKTPQTIAELFDYAYGEAGRKVNLARDLTKLIVETAMSQKEIKLVRQLAADDPLLAVPPNLLAALAEVQTEAPVRQRLLELVLVAFADHGLFADNVARLSDPRVEPALTAREISSAARIFMSDAIAQEERAERRSAMRDQLRANAVTAFELFRVLRDGWTSEQFINDMCALIWDDPIQHNAPRVAALLTTANSTDMSQLARHFERLLHDSQLQTAKTREQATQQLHRADSAEAQNRSLGAALEAERARVADLQSQADDLAQRLRAEQSSRVVDSSHFVDDYEVLRTQIVRQLTAQIELLGDGLHALRKGRTVVAEEFVDRALSKIQGEVKRLKHLDGGEL